MFCTEDEDISGDFIHWEGIFKFSLVYFVWPVGERLLQGPLFAATLYVPGCSVCEAQ